MRNLFLLFFCVACNSDTFTGSDTGCPDLQGKYSITLAGQGCGDTTAVLDECVQQNACSITLTSAGLGVSGTTSVQADGSFPSAAITMGTTKRTGCIGAWDDSTATLTVDCGGTGSNQSCVATLKRVAATCP